LLLRNENTLFSAALNGQMTGTLSLEPASVVKVAGVALFTKDATFQPRGMQILLRGVSDLTLLARPPLWNLRRMGLILAALVGCILLGALWIASLRSSVASHRNMLEANVQKQRALEGQVVQSQKMESIGNLAGGVAHDFNNLLTIILGYSSSLTDEKLSQSGKEAVEEITGASKRAADLTRQLLLFSRKQAVERAILDLNATARGLMRMLGRLLGEDISLEIEEAPGALLVDADKGMINRSS
jgi:signal transduction histidine kinase